MTTTDRTVDTEIHDRLVGQYDAHARFARDAFAAADAGANLVEDAEYDPDGTDPLDALAERPLSVEVTRRVTVTMGTGGPHTELVADLNRDDDVEAVTWNGYWGGDVVTREVSRGTDLWRLAEHYAGYVTAE